MREFLRLVARPGFCRGPALGPAQQHTGGGVMCAQAVHVLESHGCDAAGIRLEAG